MRNKLRISALNLFVVWIISRKNSKILLTFLSRGSIIEKNRKGDAADDEK